MRLGGLTNRSYQVETSQGHYVIRLPGDGTETMINRHDEYKSNLLACELGIDSHLYYFNGDNCVKVMDFIEDSITLNAEMMHHTNIIALVAKVFQKLHHSDVDTGVEFEVMKMAKQYENIIQDNDVSLYSDYASVRNTIMQLSQNFLENINKVPCHNDPLCENWVLQETDKLYLIDWEYAGMNDPMWDLADVSIEADYSTDEDQLLLQSYFGRNVTDKEMKAFNINKLLIDFLWTLWGKTRVPFEGQEMEDYASARYTRLKKLLVKMQEKEV